MSAILIRDIPEKVLEALKKRAAQNDRSLQKELKHLLTKIAQETPAYDPLPPIQLELSNVAVSGNWRREEIYDDVK